MRDDIATRLQEHGLELLPQPEPKHPYEIGMRVGNVLYLSGKTAMRGGSVEYAGRLVGEADVERGRAAARLCALQLLSALEHLVGLENVSAVPKLTVFVSSHPDFVWQPEVANAASELIRAILGDAGRHSRSAVGVAVLPVDSTVEIELVAHIAEVA